MHWRSGAPSSIELLVPHPDLFVLTCGKPPHRKHEHFNTIYKESEYEVKSMRPWMQRSAMHSSWSRPCSKPQPQPHSHDIISHPLTAAPTHRSPIPYLPHSTRKKSRPSRRSRTSVAASRQAPSKCTNTSKHLSSFQTDVNGARALSLSCSTPPNDHSTPGMHASRVRESCRSTI